MLIFSLLLWLGGRIYLPQSPPLPALTSISHERGKAPFWGDYFWLSEDKLLLWQRKEDRDVDYTEDKYIQLYTPQLVLLDIGSTFLFHFYKSQKKFPQDNSDVTLSQDKKWALWFTWSYLGTGISQWEAASLNETKFMGALFPGYRPLSRIKVEEVPHESFFGNVSTPIWRKDGRSWVMVRGTKRAPLYDLFSLNEQNLVREIKLPPLGSVSSHPKLDAGPYLLGYLQGKQMLGFAEQDIREKESIEAFTITDDGNPKSVHPFVFSLPQKGVFEEVQLSPKGDQLAWLVYLPKPEESGYDLMTVRRQVWVSSWEGKDWKLVGDYSPQGKEKFPPTQLRWLVDGKHLSFLYQQKLWIVPARVVDH